MGQEDLQGFVLAKDAMRRNLPQEGLQGSTVDLPLSETQETCRDATRRTLSIHTVQGIRQQRMILTQLFQNLRRCIHLTLRGEGGELAKRKTNNTDFIILLQRMQSCSHNPSSVDEMKYWLWFPECQGLLPVRTDAAAAIQSHRRSDERGTPPSQSATT